MELPSTVDEIHNELVGLSFEFVGDIGLEEYYGVGLTADLKKDGVVIFVLGSIPLNESDGSIIYDADDDSGPAIWAWPDGMIEDAHVLLEGEEAVTFFEKFCTLGENGSFRQPRRNVKIDDKYL